MLLKMQKPSYFSIWNLKGQTQTFDLSLHLDDHLNAICLNRFDCKLQSMSFKKRLLLGKITSRLFLIGANQPTRCGGPAQRKIWKQNPPKWIFYVGVVTG